MPGQGLGHRLVAVMLAVIVGVGVLVRRWAGTRTWSAYEIAALAGGALIGRTLIGFLAPLSDGVHLAARLGQNVILLMAVLAVTVRVLLRERSAASRAATADN